MSVEELTKASRNGMLGKDYRLLVFPREREERDVDDRLVRADRLRCVVALPRWRA